MQIRKNKWVTAFQVLLGLLILSVPGILYFLLIYEENNPVVNVQEATKTFQYLDLQKTQFEYQSAVQIKTHVETNYPLVDYPTIDTSRLGKQNIQFTVNDGHSTATLEKEIEIVDTIAPVIKVAKKEYEIIAGDVFQINQDITVEETQTYEMTIDELDTKQPGEHEVKITAKDASGNVAMETIKVTIKNKSTQNVSVTDTKPNETNSSVSSRKSNAQSAPNKASTQESKKSNVAKRTVKNYYFTQGYNLVTGFQKCMSENRVNELGGGCEPIYDGENPIGYRFTP